nr:MAG: hypothetical protein 1 [Luteoviridae sp.]
MEEIPTHVIDVVASYADLDLRGQGCTVDRIAAAVEAYPERDIAERLGMNISTAMTDVMRPTAMSVAQLFRYCNVSMRERWAALWYETLTRERRVAVFFNNEERMEGVVRSQREQHRFMTRYFDNEEQTVVTRVVGNDWMVSPGSGEYEMLRRHRAVVTALKAYFYYQFLYGLMPVVDAASALVDEGVEARGRNRYLLWAEARYGNACSIVDFVFALVARLLVEIAKLAQVYHWYDNLSGDDKVWVEISIVISAIMFFRVVQYAGAKKLVEKKAVRRDRYLGQFMTDGGLTHKVLVGGRELFLSADGRAEVPDHEDEMAMPGSEFFPCKNQPIGAILVAAEGSDLNLFGVFWRCDDFLVTARHCSNTLNNSTARAYVASVRPTRKGNWEIDDTNLTLLDEEFFHPDQNLVTSYDVDVFVRNCTPGFWAKVKVKAASTKVHSAYNLQVHSVGFTNDGLLVSASGRTLENSGHELLHHTASTKKGFSGSVILCGSSVIGMHVSASDGHNVAIRVEWIKYLIEVSSKDEAKRKVYTYADASYKKHYRENKWRGGVANVQMMRDGNFAVVLKDGQSTYGWELPELVEAFGYGDAEKDYDMFEDMIWSGRKTRGQYISFDDENAPVKAPETIRKTIKKSAKPVKKVKKVNLPYVVEEGLKPIHGPKAPTKQPEICKVIDAREAELEPLGYVSGEFEYPEMTPTQERISLEKHLQLFGERKRKQTVTPKANMMARCVHIVSEMLQANAFMPDHDYKTVEGLMKNVIMTTIIGNDKSAGFPYCEQGMPKNGQVLEKYTPKGFAQETLNRWDDPEFDIKVFLKGEPTKKKKIVAGMPRIICGMPLHVTVKHASIFVRFCMAMIDGWKQSPIKYAFVPSKPGHLEHLKEVLPNSVAESDKSNWDFNVLDWMVKVASRVVQTLAIKPPEWTEEEFEAYLADVDAAFSQMFEKSVYRTSDGHRYRMKDSGIMKSGWFCTIAVNSVMQLVIHVMTLIIMGYEDDEIINNWPVVAGGDDVNQDLEGIDLDKYKEVTASLGVVMDIEVRESLEHSEFFSSDIRMKRGKFTFHPKRFTKHVEHLKTVKLDDAAQALLSHMENYRHDRERFAYFENLYHDMRTEYPAQFPLRMLKSRLALVEKQYGYEQMALQW